MVQDSTIPSTQLPRFYGTSQDTKPEGTLVGGATFLETDTGKGFVWTGTEWVRNVSAVVEQAGAVVVNEIFATDELLGEILEQLKRQNAHLALITGEEDIDGSSD